MLARELEELNDHYRTLVESVTSGTLPVDEAVRTLESMSATDADGYVWRLDLEGRFVAGRPGEEAQLADPQRFAQRNVPGPWDNNWSTTPDLRTPPVPTAPVSMPPATTKAQPSRQRRLPAAPSLSGLAGKLNFAKLRTPLIAGVALIAAVAVWTSHGSKSAPGTTIEVTKATESAGPAATKAPQATDDLAAMVSELIAAISDPASDPSKLIVEPGDGNKLLLHRAQFAGYRAVGMKLVVTAVTGSGDKLDATLVLRDQGGNDVVKAKVGVSRIDGTYLLTGWPEFSR